MKKYLVLILCVISFAKIGNSIENKWISYNSRSVTEPFIIVIDDDKINIYDSNLKSQKYFSINNSVDSITLFSSYDSTMFGHIKYDDLSKRLKLYIESSRSLIMNFFPLESSFKSGFNSTLDFKSNNNLWRLKIPNFEDTLNVEVNFMNLEDVFYHISYQDSIIGTGYYKWSLIEFDSILFLKFIDFGVKTFVIDEFICDSVIRLKYIENEIIHYSYLEKLVESMLEKLKGTYKISYLCDRTELSIYEKNFYGYGFISFGQNSFTLYSIDNDPRKISFRGQILYNKKKYYSIKLWC